MNRAEEYEGYKEVVRELRREGWGISQTCGELRRGYLYIKRIFDELEAEEKEENEGRESELKEFKEVGLENTRKLRAEFRNLVMGQKVDYKDKNGRKRVKWSGGIKAYKKGCMSEEYRLGVPLCLMNRNGTTLDETAQIVNSAGVFGYVPDEKALLELIEKIF